METELKNLTIKKFQELLKEDKISSREIVNVCFDNINKKNKLTILLKFRNSIYTGKRSNFMLRSLWTAASGMNGQQFNIDTISNNLSNVNTTGFKKTRAEFEDLLYQNLRLAGTPSSSISDYPTGVYVGLGVKTASTQRIFEQGAPQNTNVKTDLAIEGEGFFKVTMYDGTEAYTRDGAWKVDSNRQMVNHSGYKMEPEIIFPENFLMDSVTISQDGKVTCKIGGDDEIQDVGQVNIFRFVNPAGLTSVGGNLYKISDASGAEIEGTSSESKDGVK